MIPNRAMDEIVTRLRAVAVVDPYSGEATDLSWDEPGRLDLDGCSVQPEQGGEETFDRDMVTRRWRLWHHDPEADIEARDRIEYRGDVYEIDGEVMRWRHPRLGHLTCLLKKVDG